MRQIGSAPSAFGEILQRDFRRFGTPTMESATVGGRIVRAHRLQEVEDVLGVCADRSTRAGDDDDIVGARMVLLHPDVQTCGRSSTINRLVRRTRSITIS